MATPPFELGLRARERGKPITACPAKTGEQQALWRHGWQTAEAALGEQSAKLRALAHRLLMNAQTFDKAMHDFFARAKKMYKRDADGPFEAYEERCSRVLHYTMHNSRDVRARLRSGELHDSDAAHWREMDRRERGADHAEGVLNDEAKRLGLDKPKRRAKRG